VQSSGVEPVPPPPGMGTVVFLARPGDPLPEAAPP
jgi:hypothetical protein